MRLIEYDVIIVESDGEGGGVAVSLGTYETEEEARAKKAKLQASHPERTYLLTRVTTDVLE